MRCILVSSIAMVVGMNCLGGNLLTLVALKLGAGEFLLGLLPFVAFAPQVCSLLTLSSMERIGKRRLMLRWWSVSTALSGMCLLIPWLAGVASSTICLGVLFGLVGCRSVTNAFGNAAWMPMIHDIIPDEIIGRFFAWLRTCWVSASLVVLLLMSWFIGTDPPWWKFQVTFAAALVAYIVRTAAIIPLTELRHQTDAEASLGVWERCRRLWAEPQSRRLIGHIVLFTLAANIAVPFRVKLLQSLDYSEGLILLTTSVMLAVGAIISLSLWGKLADRFGNRAIFSITSAGMVVVMALWIPVNHRLGNAAMVVALYLIEGILVFGNGLAQTRFIFQLIPSHKQYQVTMLNLLILATPGLAPLAGSGILGGVTWLPISQTFAGLNYDVLFTVSTLLFFLAYLTRRHLHVSGDAPTRHVLGWVTQSLRETLIPAARIRREDNPNKEPPAS